MIACGISIPERDWRTWLDTVGDLERVRSVEVPASLLVGEPESLRLCEHYGLRILHAGNLLPADVARYLSETPAAGRPDVSACLKDMLAQCRDAGVRSVSIDLGLDRIRQDSYERDADERLRLLRSLVGVADELRVTVCVHVRYPRAFPGSKAWGSAANLVHDAMHPRCKLAVDLVPADFPENLDAAELVRVCYVHTAVFRFCYDPSLGETLTDEMQEVWSSVMHEHSFKGSVIFCPRTSEDQAIAEACRRIDGWSRLYAS